MAGGEQTSQALILLV